MIGLFDCTRSGLLFVQIILNYWELCGAATWRPGLLLLVVHTISISKLAEYEVLCSITYLDDCEILDSKPGRDKLVECEVIGSNYERNKMLVLSSNPEWDNIFVLISNPELDKILVLSSNLELDNILVLGSSPEFSNLFVMGSNPKFAYSEVKDLIPKEVKVNSIDWYEVLSWIPRGSCNNINWCMFRNFYGSDDDDEDDSLSGPVVESEEGFLPDEVSGAPSPPERPATPRPPSPLLPLRPPKRPKRRMLEGAVAIMQLKGAFK